MNMQKLHSEERPIIRHYIFTWLYLLKKKISVLNIFIQFALVIASYIIFFQLIYLFLGIKC